MDTILGMPALRAFVIVTFLVTFFYLIIVDRSVEALVPHIATIVGFVFGRMLNGSTVKSSPENAVEDDPGDNIEF